MRFDCRVFWLVVVIAALISGLTLLCLAWFSFQDNPTDLVIDSTHHSIWNYAFPAVTVCSVNKISKANAYRLARTMQKPVEMTTEDLALELKLLLQLILNVNEDISYQNYTKLQDLLELNNLTTDLVLKQLSPTSPSCNDMLRRCKWKGEEKRCESIFEPIRTSTGYCCAFNYFALRNHTFSGILTNNKVPVRPRRVSACGYQTALEVLLNTYPNDEYASEIFAYGHQIMLHNALNFPDWTAQLILHSMKTIRLVNINPTVTYATEYVRALDPKKRQCYFQDERYLHNFANYTYDNCLAECRMNVSRKICGCIPFYYYNPKGTYPETKLCNLRDIPCLADNRHLMITPTPGLVPNLKNDGTFFWNYPNNECNCLPDCEYFSYIAESSSGLLTREFSKNQRNLYGGVNLENHSVLRVYFNDLVAIKNRRDVYFSWHTLLAFYGGLLGLFVGFSFVSGVEIVYFFAIRFIRNALNHIKKGKAVNDQESIAQIKVKPLSFDHLDAMKLMSLEQKFMKRKRYY